MKAMRKPFVSFNPKSYLWGDKLMELARYADELSGRFDIDCMFTAPYADIRLLAEGTERLLVVAQGMDGIEPGRGMGAVLAESLKDAGAEAVILNHAERPMYAGELARAAVRCRELGMGAIICADTLEEALMIATLHPFMMICEPTSLIGTGVTADDGYMEATNEAIRKVSPETLLLQGAGVKNGDDIYRAIANGADGSGSTSGVTEAADPKAAILSMFEGAARAREELC